MERAAVGDVKRAAAFYKIIRYSYGSGCTSYGCQPFDIRKTFTIIWEANRRLKDTVIENKDFEALIRQYDRPNAFFYCDPPYFETEGHYEVVFRKEDHVRLRDTLKGIQGKFMVSYNDCAYIRELYQDFQIEAVTRINNLAQRYDNGSEFPEVLIANYDMEERKKSMPMQMNLFENIKIFIEIVDAGSFAQAAENLQIHRPAVTKALQQLERESGVRLLQRTTRRLYLTPEGEEFYRRSKPLLSQADDLLESFAPDRPIRGQLRVDMPIAFARLLVIPHLADFYQAHPEVEIVLSSSDVRRDMLRDGLDCLLRVGDLEDGDYVARSLGEVALTTCASPAYLARYGAPATLEELQSHLAVNWVNSSSRQIMPWRFQTPEGIRQIAIPGKLVLDNSEVFTAAGLAGLGMLQGMRFFLQPYIDSGELVEILPDFPAPRRPLSLLYPHRHLSHKVRVFAEWLQRLVATLDRPVSA